LPLFGAGRAAILFKAMDTDSENGIGMEDSDDQKLSRADDTRQRSDFSSDKGPSNYSSINSDDGNIHLTCCPFVLPLYFHLLSLPISTSA